MTIPDQIAPGDRFVPSRAGSARGPEAERVRAGAVLIKRRKRVLVSNCKFQQAEGYLKELGFQLHRRSGGCRKR